MARIDKIDGESGSTRARLAADRITAPYGRPVGVGIDTNGRIVNGDGQSGVIGILVLTKRHRAGDQVDILRNGEIVEFDPVTAGTYAPAGTKYYANTTTGALTTTNTGVLVGHTVEAGRLVVWMKPAGGA